MWCRDVWLGALFKVDELTNDASVVEALVVRGCIIMATKQLAGGCRCGLCLGVVSLEAKFFKDAVNQVRLCQVDHTILVALDVNPRKSDMSPSTMRSRPTFFMSSMICLVLRDLALSGLSHLCTVCLLPCTW